jgi:hypothetical protein
MADASEQFAGCLLTKVNGAYVLLPSTSECVDVLDALVDRWVSVRAAKLVSGEAVGHWSGCAVHNEPAFPAGPCDCGGIYEVAA